MNYIGTDMIEAELRDRLAELKIENHRLLARLEKLEAVAAAARDYKVHLMSIDDGWFTDLIPKEFITVNAALAALEAE